MLNQRDGELPVEQWGASSKIDVTHYQAYNNVLIENSTLMTPEARRQYLNRFGAVSVLILSGCSGTNSDQTPIPDQTPTPSQTPSPRGEESIDLSVSVIDEVDKDGNGRVSSFKLRVNADTRLLDADSTGPEEPYIIIDVADETLIETDVLEGQWHIYSFGPSELEQFDEGTLEIRVRLMDKDSAAEDEIASWTGTVEYESPPTPTDTPQRTVTSTEQVPEYSVVNTEDLSYGSVLRARIDVKTEHPVSKLTRNDLLLISRDIVERVTQGGEVNALTIFFWEENAVVGSQQAYANVDWAPYGEWERAGDVDTGDYSQHEYAIEIF